MFLPVSLRLSQVFGRSFHSAMLDVERQDFYRKALELLAPSVASAEHPAEHAAYVVILGLGLGAADAQGAATLPGNAAGELRKTGEIG